MAIKPLFGPSQFLQLALPWIFHKQNNDFYCSLSLCFTIHSPLTIQFQNNIRVQTEDDAKETVNMKPTKNSIQTNKQKFFLIQLLLLSRTDYSHKYLQTNPST